MIFAYGGYGNTLFWTEEDRRDGRGVGEVQTELDNEKFTKL